VLFEIPTAKTGELGVKSESTAASFERLLRASFRPKAQIAELRAYVRQRGASARVRGLAAATTSPPGRVQNILPPGLGLAPSNKISEGKMLSARTRRSGGRAAALLRLAAVTRTRRQAALGAHRQGQGGHRHGAQGRSPVLQCRAARNGVRRPRCVVYMQRQDGL
jgi:hypothetical protein